MSLTTEQQEALDQPQTRIAFFVEFDYAGGVGRYCTSNENYVWNGHTWLGVGAISRIGTVQEKEGASAQALDFVLAAVFDELLTLAAGSVEEYRGRGAKMWRCPLDEGYQLIGDPEICWRGTMDLVTVDIDGAEIVKRCETSAYGLKRRQGLRINADQHKLKHPTDTGFDHIPRLIANKTVWISKQFQKQ